MKRPLSKLLAILLSILGILASFCACNAPQGDANTKTPGSSAASELKIGLLVERLGDNSLSDMLCNAVKKAQEKHGFQLDVSECGSGDMSLTLQDYTTSKEYDLIIMLYHGLDVAIEMQDDYPDQKYMVYDVSCEGQPNITSLSYAKNEMGFMAGVFAALMEDYGAVSVGGETKTWTAGDKYAALIGVNLPSTVGAITGYQAGIRYIKPDADVVVAEIGSWADQAAAKELALTMYNAGVNILFHNAGGSALGALEAAKTLDRFMIGFDANQNSLDAVHMLASSHKDHDAVIGEFFDGFVAGTFRGGENVLNSYANSGIAFSYQENFEVPEEVRSVMDEVKGKLTAGEIVPPGTVEELDAWLESYS